MKSQLRGKKIVGLRGFHTTKILQFNLRKKLPGLKAYINHKE